MAKKKGSIAEMASMQPEEVTDVPNVPKENLARNMAVNRRLPMISKDTYDKLVESLRPLGVKFEQNNSRTGIYKEGKEPFGAIVKMMQTTFVVDFSNNKE